MLSFAVAAVAGLLVGALTSVAFTWWAGILPALAVFAGVYFFSIYRVNKLVSATMPGVMAAAQKRDLDGAVNLLKAIRARFARWAPFLGSQIDGQIGSILFMKKDFEKARPFLEAAFVRSWDAKLMLAVMKSGALDAKKLKKQELSLDGVDAMLEKTARFADKQGLMWSTWAWLHWSNGNSKRALELLHRGKDKLGESDPHLSQNLLALQNDKKMKMKGYGDQWYAFHLEAHPLMMEQRRGGQVRFARR